MSAIIVAGVCTASATVVAAIIVSIATTRSSRRVQQINDLVKTPEGVPDLGRLVVSLFEETIRQGREISTLSDKLDEHLGWHEGYSEHGDV